MSSPYVGGLATQAPGGIVMLAVAAILAGGRVTGAVGTDERGGWRLGGLMCVALGVAMAGYRLVG